MVQEIGQDTPLDRRFLAGMQARNQMKQQVYADQMANQRAQLGREQDLELAFKGFDQANQKMLMDMENAKAERESRMQLAADEIAARQDEMENKQIFERRMAGEQRDWMGGQQQADIAAKERLQGSELAARGLERQGVMGMQQAELEEKKRQADLDYQVKRDEIQMRRDIADSEKESIVRRMDIEHQNRLAEIKEQGAQTRMTQEEVAGRRETPAEKLQKYYGQYVNQYMTQGESVIPPDIRNSEEWEKTKEMLAADEARFIQEDLAKKDTLWSKGINEAVGAWGRTTKGTIAGTPFGVGGQLVGAGVGAYQSLKSAYHTFTDDDKIRALKKLETLKEGLKGMTGGKKELRQRAIDNIILSLQS